MPSDVRRSARGAPPVTSKPPPPASTASSSSLSSSRQDKSAKSHTLPKSATPHSRSSEEMSEPPRRSQRAQHPKDEDAVKDSNDAEEDAGEEEEVTRCICGQQDYPGPPLSEAFTSAALESDDAGGLFISCDGCSVWQHGGCVGIIEENQVPDKYYCEECRPKLHELHTDSRGQRYSLYQPVNGKTHRKGSMSKHGDKAQRERENTASRASADPTTGRRRATMRSKEHDDEEEQILRAIEESRREVEGGNGRRNGKRVRDESDDSKHDVKRQRRASELQPSHLRRAEDASDSEDEPTTAAGRSKKAKAEAAQSARQAEVREKEKERESKRAEAAGRRQERAGRRRVDEDLEDVTPKPTNSARTSPPPSSQPGSPQPNDGLPEKISHKKGAGKKVKKLGNNQYTKIREQAASSPHGRKGRNGGHGTSSGEENATNGDGSHLHLPNGSNGAGKGSPDIPGGVGLKGKFGKGKHKAINGNGGTKHEEPAELTILNMKRRMEAMAAFIARVQMESAGGIGGDRTPLSGNAGIAEDARMSGGAVQSPLLRIDDGGGGDDGKKFEEMTAMEMADVVSRSINGWHSRFDHLVQ